MERVSHRASSFVSSHPDPLPSTCFAMEASSASTNEQPARSTTMAISQSADKLAQGDDKTLRIRGGAVAVRDISNTVFGCTSCSECATVRISLNPAGRAFV
ncbi:hypothetical protein CC2G_012570 [Coprinopsis cinerea AmutBmut pab1-1]|nr:hypothetical protein CC2G_012570 [Coprinopsis cinerea AmutBmut pab1-1]